MKDLALWLLWMILVLAVAPLGYPETPGELAICILGFLPVYLIVIGFLWWDNKKQQGNLNEQLEAEYSGQARTLAQQIELYKDRIEGYKERIELYRERLNNSETTSTIPIALPEARLENKKPQKLLTANVSGDLSNENLKNEALKILIKINETVETTKSKTSDLKIKRAEEEARIETDRQFNPPRYKFQELLPEGRNKLNRIESQITKISSEVISEFNREYISKALQARNVLIAKVTPEDSGYLSEISYTKIKTLRDLENLRIDLEKLIKHL